MGASPSALSGSGLPTPVVGKVDDLSNAPDADVVVIVPTLNERENIAVLFEEVCRALGEVRWPFEILVVDDRSLDGTAEIAREAASRCSARIGILERSAARGLAASVLDGIDASNAPVILVMDADLSHPPSAIPSLVEPVLGGRFDLVVGSRYVEGGRTVGWGLSRKLNSRVATLLAAPLAKRMKDPLSGFFAIRRAACPPRSVLGPRGFKIGLEIIVKSQSLRIQEVPIRFLDRSRGRSKLGVREKLAYLRHLISLYAFKTTGRNSAASALRCP